MKMNNNQGDIFKYTIDGKYVKVVGKTSEGYIVSQVYEVPAKEPGYKDLVPSNVLFFEVSEVYDDPPEAVYSDMIHKLQMRLIDLENYQLALEKEIKEQEKKRDKIAELQAEISKILL